MHIVRRTACVPLPMVVCPVIAVAMLESRVARCVQCVENVACLRHVDKYKITFKLVINRWTNEMLVTDICYTDVI